MKAKKIGYLDKRFVGLIMALILAGGGICYGLEDAIGDPTVPPSSRRSGLHRSPNPIDTRSNLVVTGNVAGGKHFRGNLPYRATTEFGAQLGSSSIDSFLRYSAPIDNRALSPRSYYSPTSTVTSLWRNGSSGLISYPTIRSNRGTGELVTSKIPTVVVKPDVPAVSPLYEFSRTRPSSFTTGDLEDVVAIDLKKEYVALEKVITKKAAALERRDEEKRLTSLQRGEPMEPAELTAKPAEAVKPGEIAKVLEPDVRYRSVYEAMLAEIKLIEPLEEAQADEKAGPEPGDIAEKQEKKGPLDMKSGFSEITPETAKATVGVHKSFAADAQDKFNYYMRAAEEFLEEGKYYRAADAYSLASVYKPSDPLAYAGRSHALFASGEYMSSAYFLIKTLELFPGYARFKIDLNAMIPDRDRIESRVADIKEWIEKTESPELSMLLAYIYHQLGMDEFAIEAIDYASEKVPGSAVIGVLKAVIKKD